MLLAADVIPGNRPGGKEAMLAIAEAVKGSSSSSSRSGSLTIDSSG